MSDPKDQKGFPPSQRTASSTPKSRGSSPTGGGSLLDQPIAKPTGGGDTAKAFLHQLILRLQSMEEPFRMAKVMPDKPGEPQIDILGFIRKNWIGTKPGHIKAVKICAYRADLYAMGGYETYEGLGAIVEIPLDSIKGFQWAQHEEEVQYFNGLGRGREPN